MGTVPSIQLDTTTDGVFQLDDINRALVGWWALNTDSGRYATRIIVSRWAYDQVRSIAWTCMDVPDGPAWMSDAECLFAAQGMHILIDPNPSAPPCRVE